MPKIVLTAASVTRIKPPAKGQVEYFDKGHPGLALRVSYGGNRSFVIYYRINGRLRRMKLGAHPVLSLVEARDAWRDARREALAGRDPGVVKRVKPVVIFDDVVEEWLKRDQAGNRSAGNVAALMKLHVAPSWSGRDLKIGRAHV